MAPALPQQHPSQPVKSFMPTVLKSRLLRAPTARQALGAHTYPGSGDKAGLRSGESLHSKEGEGIRANRPERGWESCFRLLPPVWAGPGWMAKLVVAMAPAPGQGQTLPQSTDAAVSEGRGPVCGRDTSSSSSSAAEKPVQVSRWQSTHVVEVPRGMSNTLRSHQSTEKEEMMLLADAHSPPFI